jgi:3-hydroxyacyl-CoA dehydrogenase
MRLEDVRKVAVLGTGMMGPGIALQFAKAGYDVALWGIDEDDLVRGRAGFVRALADLTGRGVLSATDARAARGRLTLTRDLAEAVSGADFVSEAVPETLELKQAMFARLEGHARPDTVLSSNTSGLMPSRISERMSTRSRMLVAHFWNPAHLCPLVEVCGNPETTDAVKQLTVALLRRLGNRPVLIRVEIPGFIGNRIMHAMNREAISLVQKGVCTAEEIDEAVLASFGPRFANLGIMEYLDFSSLDHIARIQSYLYDDLENGGGTMPLVADLVRRGRLGAKSGSGLCDWSAKTIEDVRTRRDQEFVRRLEAAAPQKAPAAPRPRRKPTVKRSSARRSPSAARRSGSR